MKKWDTETTCADALAFHAEGVSYILPRSESAGFEFHPFGVEVQEDLLKFLNDYTARDAFEALPLPKFWSKMSESYPQVAEVPIGVLLMFPSTQRTAVPNTRCVQCIVGYVYLATCSYFRSQ